MTHRFLIGLSLLVIAGSVGAYLWLPKFTNTAAVQQSQPKSPSKNDNTSEPDVAPKRRLNADDVVSLKPEADTYESSSQEIRSLVDNESTQIPARMVGYNQNEGGKSGPPSGSPFPSLTRLPSDGVPVPAAVPAPAALQNALPANLVTPPTGSAANTPGVWTLAFVNDIEVAAQTDGQITHMTVDEGTVVRSGDLIIQIDSRIPIAEQTVAQEELNAAELKSSDDSNMKFSAAAFDVAKIDEEKSVQLYEKNAEGEMEYRKKRLERLKAGFQVDVAKIEKKRDAAAAEVARAKLNAATVQVSLRQITAPFDGVVAETKKERYDTVKAGEYILRLVSMEKLRVKGTIRVTDSPNLLVGTPVRVTIEVAPGKTEVVDSVVSFVSPIAVNKNSYPVWIEISNRVVNNQYVFRGGMSATVDIISK